MPTGIYERKIEHNKNISKALNGITLCKYCHQKKTARK